MHINALKGTIKTFILFDGVYDCVNDESIIIHKNR